MQIDYLTVGESARLLNRSGDAVRLYERQGRLPAIRTRKGWRLFKATDVERLAKELKSQDLARDHGRTL